MVGNEYIKNGRQNKIAPQMTDSLCSLLLWVISSV